MLFISRLHIVIKAVRDSRQFNLLCIFLFTSHGVRVAQVLASFQARRNVLGVAGGRDFGKGIQKIAWGPIPPPQKKKFVILNSCENTKKQ